MTHRWTRTGLLAAAASLALATVVTPAVAAPSTAPTGTILGTDAPTALAGQFIVKLRDSGTDSVDAAVTRLTARYGGTVTAVYRTAVRGFAVSMGQAAAERLAADPAVEYVEQDSVATVDGTQPNPPAWGIDRIDQRNLPLNNSYTYPNTAATVRAYIIDTGVLLTHTTFGGRATSGIDVYDNDNDATDCNGHGTHVAGTVGGAEYGVAKRVQIVAVKVLDCGGFGDTSDLIEGVDWVTANAVLPAVANMSLRNSPNQTLDTAVQNSIASGVVYAVSAGNSSASACGQSPARVPEAITTGATAINDRRAYFSNYGTCVDLFAPGDQILSSYIGSPTATEVLSGTSMASPHAAGSAALYLQIRPTATAQQVRDALVSRATSGLIPNPGQGSPNKLLYVGR